MREAANVWPDDPERGQLMLAECEPGQRFRLGSLKEDAQPGPPQQEKKFPNWENSRVTHILSDTRQCSDPAAIPEEGGRGWGSTPRVDRLLIVVAAGLQATVQGAPLFPSAFSCAAL